MALEQTALRTICGSDEKLSSLLLGSLDDSYFHFEPCKAAFQRVYTVARKRSVILSYSELLEDPALNEDFREILRNSEAKQCRTELKVKRLRGALDKYRKTRKLYEMAKTIIEDLKQAEVDVDKMLDTATDSLTDARSSEELGKLLHTIGKDGDALDLAEEAMSVEDEVLLKSGYTEIDTRNGGIPAEGVMLLAATTSGGKSTMLMNLLLNLYKLNKVSCVNVSLEMNARKLTRRVLSCLTQIPYWKYVKKALSEDERAQSRKAWRRLHKFGEKYDCRFSQMCPTYSVSITQLFMLLKPFGYKVVGIDYISLLEGVDVKDQWKALSAITREAKIFSAENKCLVILLAQLDSDDDRIRYSKGILEHVDAAWTWNYAKPEVRETKTIPVKQAKARDQELFPFELREAFEVMSVFNMEDAGSAESGKESKPSVDLNSEQPEMEFDAGQA